MKKIITFLAVMGLSTPAFAGPIAYPGSSWGTITAPIETPALSPEAGDWVYSGRVTQGVDWTKIHGWTLDTYVTVGLNLDSKGFDYNNKVTPGIGVKVTHPIPNGIIEFGIQGVNETRFGNKYVTGNRSSTSVQAFASYWIGWGR